jgi:hypothetical protein
MTKIILAALFCSFPFASAYAKAFECSGSNLPKNPFDLEMNSGVMPLEAQYGYSVSVEYTSEGLGMIVNSNEGRNQTTVKPDQYGYTTYVDGSFFVVCKASE